MSFQLPDTLHKCEACGRFVSDSDMWSDHDKRGCEHRKPVHDCTMGAEHCGIDVCLCILAPFCSEACADRWHGLGVAR